MVTKAKYKAKSMIAYTSIRYYADLKKVISRVVQERLHAEQVLKQ